MSRIKLYIRMFRAASYQHLVLFLQTPIFTLDVNNRHRHATGQQLLHQHGGGVSLAGATDTQHGHTPPYQVLGLEIENIVSIEI